MENILEAEKELHGKTKKNKGNTRKKKEAAL
jgi:hypothetical protein